MKIGDIVEVKDNGRTYCSYAVWAKRNNLTRWVFDDRDYTIKYEKTYLPRERHPYKIIAIDIHTRPDQKDNGWGSRCSDILYGIEDLETGHQYIIHNSAVCFIKSGEKQLQFSF